MEKEIESLNSLVRGKEVKTRTYKGRVYKLENVNEAIKISIIGSDGVLHQMDFIKGFVDGSFSFKNEAVNSNLKEMRIIKRAIAKKK